MITSGSVLSKGKKKNYRKNFRENRNTHVVLRNGFRKIFTVCEIISKDKVEPDRKQMAI